MAKRPNPSKLRSVRTYTVTELADALNTSAGTIRGYIRQGLPILNNKRPALILGEDAKDFLTKWRKAAKRPLALDELYCLSCKSPRRPFGNLVDLTRQTGRTARISGLCEVCDTLCHRVVSDAQLASLSQHFDVTSCAV